MHDAAIHLTFGCFTAALLATAAVALAAGVQFLVIGLRQRFEPTYLAFAALCICIATLAVANALLDVAHDLDMAITALRVMCAAALLSLPALVLFVGGYTSRTVDRRAFIAVCALTLLLFGINLQSPYTLLDTFLQEAPPTVLPWGESLFTLEGTPSTWSHVFRWFSYAIFVWALYRAARQYLGGQRLRGALLGGCLLIQFLTLLWGMVVVSTMGKPYPSLDAFAFLFFVLLMGATLAGQIHAHAVQLERTAAELRIEAQTRREAELDLRHAAYHDALTGLPNRLRARHALSELLADAMQSGHHGALLMIDLDNFKTINDSLGHHFGDRVLETIADKLLAAAPAAATVARFGGDEFVVLLSALAVDVDAASAQAMQVADDMLERLAGPQTIEGRVLGIGASIGVAVFPALDAEASDVIRRADIALYRAKSAGRNAARLFLAYMQRDADDRLELERGLRTALEHRELSLHFQPQMDMSGKLVGAEALLRWQHPRLGAVPPDTFIPVAEETGLIHALGTWVIADVCQHISEWRRLGVDFGGRIAVNVSPWQIAHPQFASLAQAQVTTAGIAPSCLTLELTESALLNDFDAALHTLHQLSTIGFRLALDDFGTGYSSLAYLQQLPLDELKIDRSFIQGLQPAVADPLVGFIIDVGRRLGMTTMAEGVETLQQKNVLQSLGCDTIQGYGICRPLDSAAFLDWLNRYAANDGDVDGMFDRQSIPTRLIET